MDDIACRRIGDPAGVGRQAAAHQFCHGLAKAAPGVMRETGGDAVQIFVETEMTNPDAPKN